MQDYSGLIRDVIQPDIRETHFAKPYEQLASIFTDDVKGAAKGGPKILIPIRMSVTSNVANYTKADVNPVAGSFETVEAWWTRIYTTTAVEVHGIDQSQAKGDGQIITDLLRDAIATEMPMLWEKIYNNVYAQIKLDIDAAGSYSDAALSRSTYPTIASYEEATNATITLAYMRAAAFSTRLNKNTLPESSYKWLMQENVYKPFKPLAAAEHTFNQNTDGGGNIKSGFQAIGTFDTSEIFTPQGMTTGDVFYVLPQDVKIQKHRDLEIEQVESGKDSVKMVLRVGINAYCDMPGRQGKMTDKDE
jgi:hypothetical protein